MPRLILTVSFVLCYLPSIFSLHLSSQEEIDNFPINFPNVVSINEPLIITGNDITNLDALSQIDSVMGNLTISNCPDLLNLDGLSDLAYVGEGIQILSLSKVEYINGFNKIEDISGGLSISSLDNLKQINGFLGLKNTYSLFITSCGLLTSIDGFHQLKEIISTMILAYLTNLEEIKGFSTLETIGSGGLILDEIPILVDTEIFESLRINEGQLFINDFSLLNFKGFKSLERIDGLFIIQNSDELVSFEGLENLKKIGGITSINNNNNLETLSGLDNLIPEMMNIFNIESCPKLSNCSIKSFCEALQLADEQISFSQNTQGCNSKEEVVEACMTINTLELDSESIIISPNPTDRFINIHLENKKNVSLKIIDQMGRVVYHLVDHTSSVYNLELIQKGIYVVLIEQDGKIITNKKIMVQ